MSKLTLSRRRILKERLTSAISVISKYIITEQISLQQVKDLSEGKKVRLFFDLPVIKKKVVSAEAVLGVDSKVHEALESVIKRDRKEEEVGADTALGARSKLKSRILSKKIESKKDRIATPSTSILEGYIDGLRRAQRLSTPERAAEIEKEIDVLRNRKAIL